MNCYYDLIYTLIVVRKNVRFGDIDVGGGGALLTVRSPRGPAAAPLPRST
jgi:hypothetical protein